MANVVAATGLLAGSVAGLIYLSPTLGESLETNAHFQGDPHTSGLSGAAKETIDFFAAQKVAGVAAYRGAKRAVDSAPPVAEEGKAALVTDLKLIGEIALASSAAVGVWNMGGRVVVKKIRGK